MAVNLSEDALRRALGQVDELEPLGGGGQGFVWRIRRNGQDRVVKVIGNTDPVRVAREIEALQAVDSPQVMSYFATLTVRDGTTSLPAIVGEYVPGGTVTQQLQATSFPSPVEALQCTRGVLQGLAAMHEKDRVHRDIKPQNVALRDGRWDNPVVLDLGLVRDLEDSVTRYPNLVGTLPFMSPEQLRQERAVKRTDVFGAGAMLFLLLTEELPYWDGTTDQHRAPEDVRRAMLDRVEQAGWPRWSRVQHRLDADVADVLARLLATEAYERPTVATAIANIDGLLTARGA